MLESSLVVTLEVERNEGRSLHGYEQCEQSERACTMGKRMREYRHGKNQQFGGAHHVSLAAQAAEAPIVARRQLSQVAHLKECRDGVS